MGENDPNKASQRLVYLRNVHNLVIEWYKNADTKALAILTVNGLLITYITGLSVLKPSEIKDVLNILNEMNILLLVLMAISMVYSIFCALFSFQSRIGKENNSPPSNHGYLVSPEKMMFFGHIASLSKKEFTETSKAIDEKFEIIALSSQIHILSTNVLHKHKWVNRAFWSFGASLLFLLMFTTLYMNNLNKLKAEPKQTESFIYKGIQKIKFYN
ncbi:Pycsar system effector family protein [Marinigracilibium pacificum]|uniref:Pycsar effector protein domain-containing protein n=1 Tax=Marinigracilibium pacificum TaxID=2729599 RepID=A0A848IZV9_9BACT|nr:Pycsar system effector family protein [Marinigracilibium pacificum]NMM49827.1 hypothetical protein [Marinigracilibium pacificum]